MNGMVKSGQTKIDLKDVFGDVGSVIYSETDVKIKSGALVIPSDGIEFPVTVDTLNLDQSDPTINHYKVVGLSGDWFATSAAGDLTFGFTVPSKAKAILTAFYGEDAVNDVNIASLDGSKWSGQSLMLTEKTLEGTIIMVNKTEDQIMIINNVKLWAKPTFSNTGTDPFAFSVSGTLTVADSSTTNPDTANFAWLRRGEKVSG